jgi:hypothetical protein
MIEAIKQQFHQSAVRKKEKNKMKKLLFAFVVLAVLVSAFALTDNAYAQTATSPAGYGQGGGRGFRGGSTGAAARGTQDGILHDELVAAFAEELDLSLEDINTRLASGETMAQIALSAGYTFDEFQSFMLDARTEAINEALAAGEITQQQADWMLQHGFGMSQGRGAGQGRFANPGCPYTSTVNP